MLVLQLQANTCLCFHSFRPRYLFDVQFLQRRNLNHVGHGATFSPLKLTKMSLTVHTTTQLKVLVSAAGGGRTEKVSQLRMREESRAPFDDVMRVETETL